jgi:hypothetical protein
MVHAEVEVQILRGKHMEETDGAFDLQTKIRIERKRKKPPRQCLTDETGDRRKRDVSPELEFGFRMLPGRQVVLELAPKACSVIPNLSYLDICARVRSVENEIGYQIDQSKRCTYGVQDVSQVHALSEQ